MKGRPKRTRTDNEKEKKLNRRDVVIRNADARIGRQELQKQEPRQRRWIRRCVALRGREQRVEILGVLTTERKRKKAAATAAPVMPAATQLVFALPLHVHWREQTGFRRRPQHQRCPSP